MRQLARIGIWQALERWDGLRPPDALAWRCAHSRIHDALTHAHRESRRGDRLAVSGAAGVDGERLELVERLAAPIGLEEQLEERARLRAVLEALPSLTPLERDSLAATCRGERYAATAGDDGKSVDNAIQRARAKLRAAAAAAIAA